MECRVEFDYVAQEEDELNLKKGDLISNVNQKMEGWWEGTLRGKTGMFPDNFVKIIEKSSSSGASVEPTTGPPKTEPGNNNVSLRNNSIRSVRKLKALFSYCPEQEDELRLDIGDEIEFLTEVEEGWWRGKLKGRVGIFPSNFVSESDYKTNGNVKAEPEQKQNDLSKISHSKGVPDVVPELPTSPPPEDDPEPAPELPPKPVRELGRCFYPYKAQNEDELNLNEGDIVIIISKNCEDEGWWRGELKGKTGLFPDNFVKIIPANEAANQPKPTIPTVQTTKMSPQGRNLTGVKPLIHSGPEPNVPEKTNGTSVVDGIGNSKMQDKEKDKEKDSVLSKVAMFSNKQPISFNRPLKPTGTTPTSPVGPGSSPLSIPPVGKLDIKRESSISKDEKEGDDEFNFIERGDKLNHPTVTRAKAPKRRPPSTVLNREDKDEENDISMTNGTHHLNDSMDSPVNHSTPYNSTLNINMNTPSASLLDASGASALSPENNTSTSTPNTSGSSALKSKVNLPWMAELRQTQDKKRGFTSPGTTPPNTSNILNASSHSAGSPTSLPPILSPNIHAKEKEPMSTPVVPAKAPPLPAKPSSLSVSASGDKSSNPSSPSTSVAPGTIAPLVSNRVFGMNKKPAPVTPVLNNHMNSGHDGNSGSGDTKQFVSYEEYAKLQDRVKFLESELETVKKQVKLLLDKDLNQGHIV